MKFVYLDTEFRDSNEKLVTPICLVTLTFDELDSPVWHEFVRPFTPEKLYQLRQLFKDKTLVAYGAGSEAGFLRAIGIDPNEYKWVCLLSEWKQLTNENDQFQYGEIYVTRKEKDDVKGGGGYKVITTTRPNNKKDKQKADARDEYGNEITATSAQAQWSLVSACYGLLKVKIDSEHKEKMRDLILGKRDYTESELEAIVKYCGSDVEYLPALLTTMVEHGCKLSWIQPEDFFKRAYAKAQYQIDLDLIRSVGIPLNKDMFQRMVKGQKDIVRALQEDCNLLYPFFVQDNKGIYHKNEEAFIEFLRRKDLLEVWPRTPAYHAAREALSNPEGLSEGGMLKYRRAFNKGYSTDKDTLKDFEHIPEIFRLKEAIKTDSNLRTFSGNNLPKAMEYIGSDWKQRAYLNGFGTGTSRNSPKATSFILAQSHWMRCLVQPLEGYCWINGDYSAQEILIAACESGDVNMLEGYRSSDPYIHFCLQTGVIPLEDAHRPIKELKKLYPKERALAKGTCLGLLYSMGVDKLWAKLNREIFDADGNKVRVERERAAELHRHHHSIFSDYWKFTKMIDREYRKDGYLLTRDGWAMYGDNPNGASVMNFPIQGGGATVLRKAVRLLHERGLQCCATQHDSCTILAPLDREEEQKGMLIQTMKDAFSFYYAPEEIRVDTHVHRHGEWYSDGDPRTKFVEKLIHILDPELYSLMNA
jgi:hypothetical protein